MNDTNNWKQNGEYVLTKVYETGITGVIANVVNWEYYLNVLGTTINFSTTTTETLEQIQEAVDDIYKEFKLNFTVTEDALDRYLAKVGDVGAGGTNE